jgi:hypothetical protein
VITPISKRRRANPILFAALNILGDIGLLKIASIATNNSLPPSSAGIGRRFTIERFMDISAVNERR